MKKLITCFTLVVFCLAVSAQEPARKALMGAYGSFTANGMKTDSVIKDGSLYAAGIRAGDIVISINGEGIKSAQSYNNSVADIRENDDLTVRYVHKGKETSKTIKAIARPYETSPIAEVYYDWVVYGTCSLRAITRKPKQADNTPAVLLVPGYNCGSIEHFSSGIYKQLIDEWLKNNFTVVTIEKSGLGDSYNCRPCLQVDLVTDIQTFDAGYRYMEGLPYVDKDNLFIWGHSMGGIIAPEIARKHKPRGVIVFATVFRPWAEFLPEMHRVQFPLDGHSYMQTEKDVRIIHKAYDDFFENKKTVEELYQVPEYKDIVLREFGYKKGSEDLWGRHYRYWQQIDSFDMAAAWTDVKCPVLSIFGGADFIACSELEHQLITGTVNSAHPGNCTHITIPDIDHLLLRNKDRQEAYNTFNDRSSWAGKFHHGFADTVNKWMKEQLVK